MRTGLLFLFLSVGACSPPHSFEVDVEGTTAERAELTLYGETTVMERSGQSFIAQRPGSDGSGKIEIFFEDAGPVSCSIGYVTNGEREPHRFVVHDGKCDTAGSGVNGG